MDSSIVKSKFIRVFDPVTGIGVEGVTNPKDPYETLARCEAKLMHVLKCYYGNIGMPEHVQFRHDFIERVTA